MKEKEERIKRMVAEGKVSEEEGQKLLDALKESESKMKEASDEATLTAKRSSPIISGWARASIIAGFCGSFAFPMLGIRGGFLFGLLAIIFGILGIRQIKKKTNYRGLEGAIGGIVLGTLIILLCLYYRFIR